MPRIRNKRQKGRFALVGAISTALDFGILFGLHAIGLTSIAANFISTGVAFCFSFSVNRKFTFKDHNGDPKRQIILYFLFTFFGLWILQPPIIWAVESLLNNTISNDNLLLLVAKFAATGVTLLWNYFTYSRIVFKKHTHSESL